MSFTLNTPAVAKVLADVWRSTIGGKTFYRIEAGARVTYPIRQELVDLGMSPATATRLLLEAELPVAPFKEPKPKPVTPAERCGPPPVSDEPPARETKAEKARFQLITTSSGKWGAWDGTDARIISLFYDRNDAIAELARLRAGKSHVTYNN